MRAFVGFSFSNVLRRVDGLFGLLTLVEEIDEVELRLARLGAERVTRLERLVILDGAGVVRRLHRRAALFVDGGRSLVGDGVVAPAAAGQGEGHEAEEQRFLQQSKHDFCPASRRGRDNRGQFLRGPLLDDGV